MKFVIRRVAAVFAFLGITSTIGAWLNGNSPFNSLMVFGWAWFVLLATQLWDKPNQK